MLHQKIVESPFKLKYGNYIGGEWREPVEGKYFENLTPSPAASSATFPAPMKRTSISRSTPPMRQRKNGAAPPLPSARISS